MLGSVSAHNLSPKMGEAFESITAGRFFLRWKELLALFDVTEEEYLQYILHRVPPALIWNEERAEKEIRQYLDRGRKP